MGPRGATRLRVLARKSDLVRFPLEESPLEPAVASELGRLESREARDETFDQARKARLRGRRPRTRRPLERESPQPVATLKRLLRRR